MRHCISLVGYYFVCVFITASPSVCMQPTIPSVSSNLSMELADPMDYEKFIAENSKILEDDPHYEMLVFPEDDVSVTTLPRKFRTLEVPVPGSAK